MKAHTPGPWRYNKVQAQIHAAAALFTVAEIPSIKLIQAQAPEELVVESDANARLMAAAPDLLAAAESALAFFNLLAMRYCDDNESAYQEIKPIRTALSLAVSKGLNRVVGGSLQDIEQAKKAIRGLP